MFNLFKKKKKQIEIKSPVKGKAVSITEVPDEVFASKMLGDGLAFVPEEGILYAPIDGEVVQVFPTKHALGIKSNDGLEILLHIGIETVAMSGEGFESFVNAGDKVTAGQKLIEFDIDLINQKAKSTITPLIITNMEIVDSIDMNLGEVNKESVTAIINLK
jgi:PTS system glucose-specific IIA component